MSNETGTQHSREKELTERLNYLIETIKKSPGNCKDWDTAKLLEIKNIYSTVNNLITLKATFAFLRWLENYPEFAAEHKISEARNAVDGQSANSNGFDVMFPKESPIIFAEVKCNTPVHGKKGFGSAQAKGILNDIEKLTERGVHKKVEKYHPLEGFKFLVLQDTEESRCSMEKLIKANSWLEKEAHLKIADDTVTRFEKEYVYAVFIKP